MRPRIVVLDDESSYLSLIEEFAAASLYESAIFNQWGPEIPEILSSNDLLLIDINMPNVDGLDVLMELEKIKFQGGVIIMSGTDISVIATSMKLGQSLNLNIIGSLEKPFRLAEFNRLIAKFGATARKTTTNKSTTENNLDRATVIEILEKNHYHLVFQPKVSIKESVVIGIECLTRVDHPLLGIIPPTDFIRSLEKLDLIDSYTLTILKVALNQLQPIFSANPDLNFAFNISAESLSKEFALELIQNLRESNLPPSKITIELTETSAVVLDSEALYAVSKFRSFGVNLSIDDFGTGNSTIQLLNELPFNEIKIDRSFIQDIVSNKKAKGIVKSLVHLADSIGFKLVCEGVETDLQVKTLQSLNCDIIQGYYFSEPLTVDLLSNFIVDFNTKSR